MKAALVDRIVKQNQWRSMQTSGIDICSFEYKAKRWGKKRCVVVRKDTIMLPKSGEKTFLSQQDDYLESA